MVEIDKIREKMAVVDARGNHLGTVARVEGDREIKLMRTDSPHGLHHYIPLDWVQAVDGSVRLRQGGSKMQAIETKHHKYRSNST
ncbi:hypothetical protein C3941_16810 [Kaistia algarum]|uniref:DUF2171 domain-containing protein n=1 Tax=Kaistia algarum TaxID=2083279 RepID=UPI000CE85604|nr:DUF2171 domain-containing protein [Kaistia algarum]MCX5516376.1 DUF2171 domain-containing protein [Kaistia algarum]PPE78712.1 hypothetical protein C3941_16810 [Kaistia algarum]